MKLCFIDGVTLEAKTTTVRYGPITVAQLRTQPTCSVDQAAGVLGISRAYAYRLARSGELDVITLGKGRFRVKSAALLRMLGEDA